MLEGFLREIADKHILLLGFGREGQSSLHFLKKHLPQLRIAVADSTSSTALTAAYDSQQVTKVHIGPDYLQAMDQYDLIFKSPGIPLEPEIWERFSERIISQVEIFLKYHSAKVVGITGTKGKSTCASLCHHILEQVGIKTALLGNIGVPVLSRFDDISPDCNVIMELSSHQLQALSVSPEIAVFLNLFPEHLDYYPSYQNYQEAKWNITRFQGANDTLIYNASDSLITALMNRAGTNAQGRALHAQITATELAKYPALSSIAFKHNFSAACEVVRLFGVTQEQTLLALETFVSPPHRQQDLGEVSGVLYIDDSAASIPEATIAALDAFPRTDVLIAGGLDRGVNLQKLISRLHNAKLKHLVLVPETGQRIASELSNCEYPIHLVDSLQSGAKLARSLCVAGDICLLSPGAASYNEFRDFSQRGQVFREVVLSGSNVSQSDSSHYIK